jgi:DNA-binding MarR family transcriptional regulator
LLTTTTDVVNNNVAGEQRESVGGARERGESAMSDRGLASAGRQRPRPPARPGARKGADRAVGIGVLSEHLGYLVRRLQVWVFQDFIRTLAPIEISPAQYSVLVVIAANPDLSQSDLADRLGIERARLVRVLDRLERRGLTQRLPSRTDRRSHALRLTPEGRKLLKLAKTLAARHEAHLAERLGSERRKSLIDLLAHLDR